MGRHKLFFTNANRISEGIFKMDMEIALRATVLEGTKFKICYNYNSPQDRIYGEAAICSPSSLWGDVKASIRREHSRRKPVPHIWDDHHNMDISTMVIIYHTPPTRGLWGLRTHSYFLSLMSAHEADDVTTASESYLQCIYLLFFTRNIPQQKQRHRLRGKLEAYHDITVRIFFFLIFELCCSLTSRLLRAQTIIFF